MGVIIKEVEIMGDKGNKRVHALFDSGSGVCLVRSDVIRDVVTVVELPVSWKFKVANNGIMMTNLVATFEIDIKSYFPAITTYVVDDLACELIVGANFMQQWKLKLDLDKEDFVIDEEWLKETLVV